MKLNLKMMRIEKINPAPYNPRKNLKPGDSDYQNLDYSLKEFGLVEPLILNERTGNLVGGHQRLAVLKNNGVEEVEVSVVNLPLEKEKQLNLILNKVRGDWDQDKLAALLEDLSTIPDFDLTTTGFDLSEISEVLDAFRMPDAEDDFDVEGAVEAITEPVTKPGELIEINGHRILCGDSADYESLKRLMGNEKANLADLDFPYNVNYKGATV